MFVHQSAPRDDKLLQDRFRLDIKKNFFIVRVPKVWNSLPAEVVQVPTLNTFKSKLDAYLAGILSPLWAGGWTR